MRSDGTAKPYVRSDSLIISFWLIPSDVESVGETDVSAKCSACIPSDLLRHNSQLELLRTLESGKPVPNVNFGL